LVLLTVVGGIPFASTPALAAGPCGPPIVSVIACENTKVGNLASEWQVAGSGDASIQGFATDMSVNAGETVHFKVQTPVAAYRVDIYRLGYYAGRGARKIITVNPSVSLPQNQPACANDASTGLVDCGNWAESASWAVPADAVSGIYLGRLVRPDTNGASHIVFVVRNDASHSDLLFQTSDTSWQAYNEFGGNSLYTGSPAGRAYKVSYNRPFTTRGTTPEDWVFNAEYPMVRWLESNGFDVSYTTGLDSDRRGALISQHGTFMSVGHDEYWSGNQRTNVEAARAAGVNLAFFSGNEAFWKTRWESSIAGPATTYRTLVSYKETHANTVLDPQDPPTWTGTWRDPRFSPPADGGRPENALSGTIFMVNGERTDSIRVPSADGKMRFWRNTTVATLAAGATATMPAGTLGYEWDADLDNGARPAGLIDLSTATLSIPSGQLLADYGSTYGAGTAVHHLTLFRAPSGGLVFGSGTVQWSWGLDASHDRGAAAADVRMRQATVNLLADMHAQPASLQSGLVAATATADTTAPVAIITSPAAGTNVPVGSPVTITGTATDAGGGVVGGVEVSVDGATWHPAVGRASWSYSWTPSSPGAVTLRARATDDSANLAGPGNGVAVTVGGGGGTATCPCTIFPASSVPANPADADPSAVELGVKFRADTNGAITGIRFYKSATNTGVHVGNLWNATGTLLATATFSGESSSGWQQVNFGAPVSITANTTYVASYHTNVGHYAGDNNGLASAVDRPPLHAIADGVSPNGVYLYGAGGFPNNTYQASNYWADVVFTTQTGADTTPPSIVSRSPAAGATAVSTGSAVSASYNEAVQPATVTFVLQAGTTNVAGTVTYNAALQTSTFTPTVALSGMTTYTATISGVRDIAGNLMATASWTFTTAAASPPPPPPTGPGGPILLVTNGANPFSGYTAEIMRAEGLNEYSVADISTVTATMLASFDVVVLGDVVLTAAQVTALTNWVTAGGNLVALHPDKQLAPLLGLTTTTTTLTNGYLLVNTASGPGAGITPSTIQFHGVADRYTLNGATAVATLYSTATTATANPAVTLRSVGTAGGQAAAFTFDLARSVVYTRQGNPAWAGQDRDGQPPIRANDMFFGAAAGDPQPDWVDHSRVGIPQADEQQRLLANLLTSMANDRKPLPRFWYLPRGANAAVVLTGDDHATGGTTGRFDIEQAQSPAGCSVTNWQCVRSTSYIYPGTPITNTQATSYSNAGFEIGVHVQSNCADWTPATLDTFFTNQLAGVAAQLPNNPAPTTQRIHCIAWSTWADAAKVELAHGMRLDGSYYYWPPAWVNDTPGYFTGSGLPMRYADTNGALIDVYQATTQMTDESGQSYPATVNTLLDNANGPLGFYGVLNANMHTDVASSSGHDQIVASAQARGIPLVSAKQMLQWLDARNASSFGSLAWSANALTFSITAGAGANGLQAMVPLSGPAGASLTSVTVGGSPVATTTRVIKGVSYAFFTAVSGSYRAAYSGAPPPPPPAGSSITDSTAANFQAGTVGSGTAVTTTADGEVSLAATDGSEFSGTALPTGWSATPWVSGGGATVGGGALTVDGAVVGPPTSYAAGRSLEFAATFSSAPYEHVGFGTDFNAPPWAIFSTGTGGGLLARTNNGGTVADTAIPGSWLDAKHRFRIDWTPTSVTYSIDDAVVATHAVAITTSLRTLASDFNTGGGGVVVDWMRMTPFSSPGTFTSRVLDAGATVAWSSVVWNATLPAGTAVTISVRTGTTLAPDGTWSAFAVIPSSGGTVGRTSRYSQYRVDLTTSNTGLAPAFADITLGWS
jgi:hypothetical protein